MVLQIVAVQPPTEYHRAYVEAERLRLLERVEEAMAGALHRAGWSPDDAVQDALRFISDTIADYERSRAGAAAH